MKKGKRRTWNMKHSQPYALRVYQAYRFACKHIKMGAGIDDAYRTAARYYGVNPQDVLAYAHGERST